MMNSTPEDVNDLFKTKRDQYTVEIRKKKHTEIIRAKRAKLARDLSDKENLYDPNNSPEEIDDSEILRRINSQSQFLQDALKVNNLYDANLALRKLRVVLSSSDNPPVKEVIATGVVKDIVGLIDPKLVTSDEILKEASWVLANIASAESYHVVYLLSLQIVTKAMALLDHPNLDIKENAVWILSNIAGDSIPNRDMLIRQGIVEKMDELLSQNKFPDSLLAQCVWMISNLCGGSGKPYPEYYLVSPLLTVLQRLVMDSSDPKVLQYVLWSFMYLSDGEPSQIEEILRLDVAERFIELLGSNESEIKIPALRTLGVLLTGEDDQVEYLTNLGLIEPLAKLLNHPKKMIRKNACFAISNILSANEQEIDKVLYFENEWIIKKLSQMVYEGDQDLAFEVIICFSNVCCARVLEQIDVLVKYELLNIIGDGLKSYDDVDITKTLLEMVDRILSVESENSFDHDGNGPYYKKFQEIGVYTRIENLADHPDREICNLVTHITETYLQFE